MVCDCCKSRGKTWEGSDPKCAFDSEGNFLSDNWNCGTMNELRFIANEIGTVNRDDNSCGTIGYVPVDNDFAPDDFDTFGGYIVMMWYKDRGRTDNAVFMTDDETSDITIKHAELAITTYQTYRKGGRLT
ncbi:hypothetical protein SAMN05216389_11158 [Oceanobacillus limi]|uniref:Uncharacterized protein n=2 Tax=Oceanobacillus limi TaxID=930131 RepID=A0A1I0EDC3_9BACI|nr:hypothetical protein SAMN05216389_11158 [Oceanobacillus limi]